MEAYKVWATLNLKGDAFKKMEQFSKMTKRAEAEVSKLMKNTKSLTSTFEKMGSALKIINPELSKFSTTFIRMNTNIGGASSSMTKFNNSISSSASRIGTATNRADKLASSLNAVAVQAGLVGKSMSTIRGGGIGRGRAGGAGGGRIGGLLADTAHGVAMGAGLHHAGMGLGAVGAGLGAGMLAKSALTQASQNAQYAARLKVQGFSDTDVKELVNYAETTKIKGVSKNEIMSALVDTTMATGNVKSAIMMAPSLAKLAFANPVIMGEGYTEEQQNKLVRFAEQRGGSDPNAVARAINLAQKAYSATGGKLKPSDLLNFNTMATTAGYHLSDEGLLKMIPVMQELGGFRTGTGYQAAFNTLITGKGLNTTAAKLGGRMGIMDNIKYDKHGRLLMAERPTLKKEYAKMLQENLPDFVEKVLLPKLAGIGVTDEMEVSKYVAMLLPQTGARLMETIIKNLGKSNAMFGLHQKAFGVEESYSEALGMPKGQLEAFNSAFHDFGVEFGKLIMPSAIQGLKNFTEILQTLIAPLQFIANLKTNESTALKTDSVYERVQDMMYRARNGNSALNTHSEAVMNQVSKGTGTPVQVTMMLSSGKIAGEMLFEINKMAPGNIQYGTSAPNILWNGSSPASNGQLG